MKDETMTGNQIIVAFIMNAAKTRQVNREEHDRWVAAIKCLTEVFEEHKAKNQS